MPKRLAYIGGPQAGGGVVRGQLTSLLNTVSPRPFNMVKCDGAILLRSNYPNTTDLFPSLSALGIVFGSGFGNNVTFSADSIGVGRYYVCYSAQNNSLPRTMAYVASPYGGSTQIISDGVTNGLSNSGNISFGYDPVSANFFGVQAGAGIAIRVPEANPVYTGFAKLTNTPGTANPSTTWVTRGLVVTQQPTGFFTTPLATAVASNTVVWTTVNHGLTNLKAINYDYAMDVWIAVCVTLTVATVYRATGDNLTSWTSITTYPVPSATNQIKVNAGEYGEWYTWAQPSAGAQAVWRSTDAGLSFSNWFSTSVYIGMCTRIAQTWAFVDYSRCQYVTNTTGLGNPGGWTGAIAFPQNPTNGAPGAIARGLGRVMVAFQDGLANISYAQSAQVETAFAAPLIASFQAYDAHIRWV